MDFIFLFILVFTPWLTHAFDGAVSGGGGRSVVCRDSAGKIQSAQLLDLFEAQRIYGFRLEDEQPSYSEEVSWIVNKINLGGHQVFISNYDIENDFNQRIQFVGDDLNLTPIDDSFEPIVPKDCKIEQVANYHQSGRLLIKEEIWKAFSNTNKAALLIHELAYLQARTRGQLESSYYVRRFVGFMFSTTPLLAYIPPASVQPYQHCINPDSNMGLNFSYEFFVIPVACPPPPAISDPRGCYRISFSYLGGQVVYDRTELDPIGANQLGRALNPRNPYTPFSAHPDLKSQIFDGTKFFFTVLEHNGERIPRVLLYENGSKIFVDLKCEVLEPNRKPTLFSRSH